MGAREEKNGLRWYSLGRIMPFFELGEAEDPRGPDLKKKKSSRCFCFVCCPPPVLSAQVQFVRDSVCKYPAVSASSSAARAALPLAI